MKKLLLTLACTGMLCTASMKAQITLDHIVDSMFLAYEFKTVQISATETKYFFADTATNTFSLHNMDFTPFITNIAVPEPFIDSTGQWFQALYITRTLFDCDSSNIEYAYTTPGNINNSFRIVRTDGTILFEIDSANGPFIYGNGLGGSDVIRPIVKTSDGAKLFLQTGVSGHLQILVYSLCDSLPNGVFDFKEMNRPYVQIAPNPTSQKLTFSFNFPDNLNQYELVILDSYGREITRESIGYLNKYSIDVSNFSSGTYLYTLSAKNNSYQTGKFILTK